MPSNYVESKDDYRIKYGGCYAYAPALEGKENEAPVVQITEEWKIEKLNAEGKYKYSNYATVFQRGSKNDTQATNRWFVAGEGLSLNPTSLPFGAVNLSKSVVCFITTKPASASKYRKLPHSGNFRVYDPFGEERKYLGIRQVAGVNDYFLLKAWGENKYFPALEALSEVMEHKRLAAAFSSNYFFGISKAGDGVFLYYVGRRVARVNSEGEILLKPPVHWLYELLSEYGLTVKRIEK